MGIPCGSSPFDPQFIRPEGHSVLPPAAIHKMMKVFLDGCDHIEQILADKAPLSKDTHKLVATIFNILKENYEKLEVELVGDNIGKKMITIRFQKIQQEWKALSKASLE
jgi:hypothetical protein